MRHDDDGREQRERNRGQRDEGRADVAQKKKEHDRDQDATQIERGTNVIQRRLNERGWPMQRRVNGDPFLVENRFHFLQSSFKPLGHFHRVGAILAGHGHQHAWFAHNQRVAKFRLRRLDHLRHIL